MKYLLPLIGFLLAANFALSQELILIETYELYDRDYTKTEYKSEVLKLTDIIKNRNRKPPTFREAKQWKKLLNRHCKIVINNATESNLIDKLNDHLITCIEKF